MMVDDVRSALLWSPLEKLGFSRSGEGDGDMELQSIVADLLESGLSDEHCRQVSGLLWACALSGWTLVGKPSGCCVPTAARGSRGRRRG